MTESEINRADIFTVGARFDEIKPLVDADRSIPGTNPEAAGLSLELCWIHDRIEALASEHYGPPAGPAVAWSEIERRRARLRDDDR